MTRNRMMAEIKDCLDKNDLPADGDAKQIAEIAVDCTLHYVLHYVTTLSEELIVGGSYSEALTAGVISLKLRDLLDK